MEYSIPSSIRRIKIDIGLSYSAPQSQVWLTHDSDLFVFGFEPNPDCIASISAGSIVRRPGHGEPLSNINATRFHLMPFALSDVSAETTMDFYMSARDCGTSSLFKPHEATLGETKAVVKVPVIPLRRFFEGFPWERFPFIEYMKIDAQGSDLQILKSAGAYLSERIVYVTAEPEYITYDGCSNNTFENIRTYMESQGFVHISHPNTSDPTFLNRKFAHLADSIFIHQAG